MGGFRGERRNQECRAAVLTDETRLPDRTGRDHLSHVGAAFDYGFECVEHGPVRWTNARFEAVLDTLKAVVERRPYMGEVISARSIGESSFVSTDRRTTFLIAALTPESTHDLSEIGRASCRERV